jgi:hypothetical protein
MLSTRKIILIVVIILFIFMLINKTEKFTDTACEKNQDCSNNQRCIDKKCYLKLNINESCQYDEDCSTNKCLLNQNENHGICVNNICSSNFDCKYTEQCNLGQCTPKLENNEICKSFEECKSGRCFITQGAKKGICVNKISEKCEETNNCDCKINTECESGLCYNGKCCIPGTLGCMCLNSGNCVKSEQEQLKCTKNIVSKIFECVPPSDN